MPAQPEFTADTAALPGKGKPNAADRAREAEPTFAEARRQHPVVESATDNLGQRGLDRVRTRGTTGFERKVPRRCWRRTCAGSGLTSSARSVSENGRPEPANPLEIDVKLCPAGPGTVEPCPWRRIPAPNRGGASRNRGNRTFGARPAPQRTGSGSSDTGNMAVLHRQCLIPAKRGSGYGQSTTDTKVPCSDHASLRCASANC